MIRHERGAARADVLRLRAKEAGRLHELLQFARRALRVVPRGAAGAEEFLRHDVHALVRALCGEDRGDEELQRVLEIQLAMRVRVNARPQDY